jgi:hypothetical protein
MEKNAPCGFIHFTHSLLHKRMRLHNCFSNSSPIIIAPFRCGAWKSVIGNTNNFSIPSTTTYRTLLRVSVQFHSIPYSPFPDRQDHNTRTDNNRVRS